MHYILLLPSLAPPDSSEPVLLLLAGTRSASPLSSNTLASPASAPLNTHRGTERPLLFAIDAPTAALAAFSPAKNRLAGTAICKTKQVKVHPSFPLWTAKRRGIHICILREQRFRIDTRAERICYTAALRLASASTIPRHLTYFEVYATGTYKQCAMARPYCCFRLNGTLQIAIPTKVKSCNRRFGGRKITRNTYRSGTWCVLEGLREHGAAGSIGCRYTSKYVYHTYIHVRS